MVSAQPKPLEDHAVHSERLIRHAWEQLEQGDRLQASEKAWGATAHALKAIAARRGWRNRAHTHNEVIAVHLPNSAATSASARSTRPPRCCIGTSTRTGRARRPCVWGSKASLNCCRASRTPTAELGRTRPPPNTPNAPAPAAARRAAPLPPARHPPPAQRERGTGGAIALPGFPPYAGRAAKRGRRMDSRRGSNNSVY